MIHGGMLVLVSKYRFMRDVHSTARFNLDHRSVKYQV